MTDLGGSPVPGLGPTFRHIGDADVPWQQVKAIRTAEGTTASVWEKWLAFSPDPPYLSLYARWDPGMVVRRHGHFSPHVVFVVGGEMWCGERHCPPGTHIELPLGAAFGPFVAGPEGTVLLEVMLGDPRSWGDDPASFRAALERQGAEALPDPDIDLPPWLEDLRSRWVVEGEPLVEGWGPASAPGGRGQRAPKGAQAARAPTTWFTQAHRAATSSGSTAGNMPIRNWLRPSFR